MPAYQKRPSAIAAASNNGGNSTPLSKKVRVKAASQPSGFEEDLEQLTSEITKTPGKFSSFVFDELQFANTLFLDHSDQKWSRPPLLKHNAAEHSISMYKLFMTDSYTQILIQCFQIFSSSMPKRPL
jgi:hypothetical protein